MIKTELEKILQDRGILDLARYAGWQEYTYRGVPGWCYPVYRLNGELARHKGYPCQHWKRAKPGDSGPKYCWIEGTTIYYTLPGLAEQIKAHNGVVFLANGTPGVLTYFSANLPAFCWLNGELSCPPGLADALTRIGARQLVYAPDLDKTGQLSAEKVVSVLAGKIPIKILSLPVGLGEHADVNDLWISCQFNRDLFLAWLRSLPDLLIRPKRDQAARPASSPAAASLSGQACPQCQVNYFQKVLDIELSTLARTSPGLRDNQLNLAAFAIGTLLGAGIGDRDQVERSLTDIARLIGLNEVETAKTIRSGINAGLKKPRDLSHLGSSCPHKRNVRQG